MGMTETLRLVIDGSSKGAQAAFGQLEAKSKTTDGVLGKFGGGLNKAANVATVGVVALTGVIAKSVADFEKRGALIKNTMRATGMDAAGASTLVGQWQRYGVEAGAAGMATKTLAKAIDGARQGNAMYAASFDRLGLSAEELNKMSDTEAIFAVRDALSEMGAGLDRTTIATKLLGRGSQTMSLWYSQSAESMAKTNDLLKSSGLIWDEKTVALYDKAAIAQAELKIALTGISETIARDVVPSMTPFIQGLGGLLRFAKPLAPAIVPITIALGAFVGVVKVANLLSGAWGLTFARLIPKIGATVIAEEAETVAITGQTVAIEANTVARTANGAIPLGTGSYGIGKGALPLGAAGGTAALGGLAMVGMEAAVIASTAMAIALPIALATYKENPLSPSGATVTGGHSMGGRGPASGMAYEQALTASAPAVAKRVAGMKELADITKEVNGLKPSATTVGAIARYDQRFDALKVKYPQIKAQIDKVKTALDKQGDAFEASSEAAKQAADDIIKAYSTMADFFKATNLAAVMGTPLPTAAQMAFASQSDQAAAFAKAQEAGSFAKQYAANPPASSGPHFKLVKGKWVRAAAGVDFITKGTTPIITGEAGPERVTITPLGRKGAGAGRAAGPAVKVDLQVNASFIDMPSDGQLRRLTERIKQGIMSDVVPVLAGVNVG